MASEPDDNPFARETVWPKMPQAPFRVGPLPKTGAVTPTAAAETEPAPEPVPEAPPVRTITPLFVRPIDARPTADLGVGGALMPQPRSAPSLQPTPAVQAPRPQPPEPPAPRIPVVETPVAEPPPGPAARPPVELAEVVVTPLRPPSPKPKRRRPPVAAIAASVVGLGGLAGLVYLFTRPDPAPPAPAPGPASTVAQQAPAPTLAEPAATPPPVATLPPAPTALAQVRPTAAPTPVPAAGRGARRLNLPPAGDGEVRQLSLPSDASRATEEALGAPVLALPAVAPAPPPAPEPRPTFQPPPPADPNAPIRTQRPY